MRLHVKANVFICKGKRVQRQTCSSPVINAFVSRDKCICLRRLTHLHYTLSLTTLANATKARFPRNVLRLNCWTLCGSKDYIFKRIQVITSSFSPRIEHSPIMFIYDAISIAFSSQVVSYRRSSHK